MNHHIATAIERSLHTYGTLAGVETRDLVNRLLAEFERDAPFLDKVTTVDAVIDDEPRVEELREVLFDLLLMNFFTADAKKLEEDYLESPEWEAIEEETIDRGTELLNVLLYLRECADEGIEPQLSDYLKEFLLVDEDEFQDEYRIYEPVIANQLLMESSYGEIARVAATIPENQELAELFYPMMSFFFERQPSAEAIADYTNASRNPAFDVAIYNVLLAHIHEF